MGRRCTVCEHKDHAAVDAMLARGRTLDVIANKVGVSRDAVARHKRNHLSPAIRAAIIAQKAPDEIDLEAFRTERSEGLLLNIAGLWGRVNAQMNSAEADGDHMATARYMMAAIKLFELEARFLNELDSGDKHLHLHVLQSPEWLSIRAVIFEVCQNYPEVGVEFARRLEPLAIPAIEAKANGSTATASSP